MSDLHELLPWWEKKSQKDLPPAVQELGKQLIEAQIRQQKQMKAQEEKIFQREQKLFTRIDLCQRRLQTQEERIEILIEVEVENQKIVFSKEVDRSMDAHRKVCLETTDKMLQSFQKALREQNRPKGGDTLPKKK